MNKLTTLAIISASTFSVSAMASSSDAYLHKNVLPQGAKSGEKGVALYVEQDIYSNSTKDGSYTTEAGALIDTSANGFVYIGADDQGWLAAGYGHNFDLAGKLGFTLYGELSKGDITESMLVEGVLDYQVIERLNVFAGYSFGTESGTLDPLDDESINTHSVMAGADANIAWFNLAYIYTHQNIDGSVNQASFQSDDFRTNEHEVILSMNINSWTPYVKYSHFNTNESTEFAIENDDRVIIGTSYSF